MIQLFQQERDAKCAASSSRSPLSCARQEPVWLRVSGQGGECIRSEVMAVGGGQLGRCEADLPPGRQQKPSYFNSWLCCRFMRWRDGPAGELVQSAATRSAPLAACLVLRLCSLIRTDEIVTQKAKKVPAQWTQQSGWLPPGQHAEMWPLPAAAAADAAPATPAALRAATSALPCQHRHAAIAIASPCHQAILA